MSSRPCEFPSCDRTVDCHNLCKAHNAQRSAGKTLQPILTPAERAALTADRNRQRAAPRVSCRLDYCDAPRSSRASGLCSYHYNQDRRGASFTPWTSRSDAGRAARLRVFAAVGQADEKACRRCGETKPASEFSTHGRTPTGTVSRKSICRPCNTATVKDSRNADPDAWYARRRVTDRAWAAANPEAARMAHAQGRARRRAREAAMVRFVISPKDSRRLFSQSCFACGSDERLTLEHIIPMARGGTHGIGNLTILCHSCNCSKQAMTLVEWKASDRPGARRAFAA